MGCNFSVMLHLPQSGPKTRNIKQLDSGHITKIHVIELVHLQECPTVDSFQDFQRGISMYVIEHCSHCIGVKNLIRPVFRVAVGGMAMDRLSV